MHTEEGLLKKLRQHRQQALETAIDQYSAYVATVIRNVLGASGTLEDAEELTSDVFLTLWEHAADVAPGKLKPWLGSVARNRARDRLRQRRPELPMDEDVLKLPLPSPETAALEQEQRQQLLDAVRVMEQPDKEIFLRYYYQYQTMEAIADRLQMPLGTVKSRLHRGRKRLQTLLLEQEEPE